MGKLEMLCLSLQYISDSGLEAWKIAMAVVVPVVLVILIAIVGVIAYLKYGKKNKKNTYNAGYVI